MRPSGACWVDGHPARPPLRPRRVAGAPRPRRLGVVRPGATRARSARARDRSRCRSASDPRASRPAAGHWFWTGSLADGRLYRGEPGDRGAAPSSLRARRASRCAGMQLDPRSGLVWVAGNEGELGTVYAHDARTGADRAPRRGAGSRLPQRRRRHARRRVGHRLERRPPHPAARRPSAGRPAGETTFVALTGAWPVPEGLRANGIRELDRHDRSSSTTRPPEVCGPSARTRASSPSSR